MFSLAAVPGYLFFKEAKQGEIVMPVRHKDSLDPNILQVGLQNYMEGGINTLNLQNELFSGYQKFQSGQFYLPIFVHILFLWGLVVPLSRRLAFLGAWAFLFYLIGVYEATPLYGFLYKHVFIFKYLRNLQYFLWLVLLPAYILISIEHWRSLQPEGFDPQKQPRWRKPFIIAIHIAALIFLFTQKGLIVTSWIAVSLSFLLFWKIESGALAKGVQSKPWILGLVFALIVIQPMEVYYYLGKNSAKKTRTYRYEDDYAKFKLPPKANYALNDRFASVSGARLLWYGTTWVNHLYQNHDSLGYSILDYNPLMVYDQVERADSKDFSFDKFWQSIKAFENKAYVWSAAGLPEVSKPGDNVPLRSEPITEESQQFEFIHFDNNQLKFRIQYPKKKFLVYQDAYHSQWHAFVNGKEVPIVRANYAFKGIFLEPGENIVHFRFGSPRRYYFNIAVLIMFYGAFFYLLRLAWKDFRALREGVV